MGEQFNTDTNHPTLFSSGVAVLVAVLVLALAAPAAAGDNRGSAEEVQDMVARAIAYYDEMGDEAAVARFNADPAPEFLDRDLYIFVSRTRRNRRRPRRRLLASGSCPGELRRCRRQGVRRGDRFDGLGGGGLGRLQVEEPGQRGDRAEVKLDRGA